MTPLSAPSSLFDSSESDSVSVSSSSSSSGIESEIEEDTRKKPRVKVHKGKVTEPAIGYTPEVGLQRKKTEPRGSFRRLQERGIKITDYKERGWRKQNDE